MLLETYVFYADVYLLQNFIMKLGILTLTIKILKIQLIKPVMKIVALSFGATILEIVGIFLLPWYDLYVLFSHLMLVPSMMFLLLWEQKEYIGKALIIGYLSTIVINGVVEVLWNLLGKGWGYPLLILAGNVMAVFVLCYAIRYLRMHKGIYPIDITLPDIIWNTSGFYDSGNHLKDPYTGKSVHIISEKLAKRMELPEEGRLTIPFQSLGLEDGLIEVCYVEQIVIKKQGNRICFKDVPLAIANDGLFAGKSYQMIMNEDVW